MVRICLARRLALASGGVVGYVEVTSLAADCVRITGYTETIHFGRIELTELSRTSSFTKHHDPWTAYLAL